MRQTTKAGKIQQTRPGHTWSIREQTKKTTPSQLILHFNFARRERRLNQVKTRVEVLIHHHESRI